MTGEVPGSSGKGNKKDEQPGRFKPAACPKILEDARAGLKLSLLALLLLATHGFLAEKTKDRNPVS